MRKVLSVLIACVAMLSLFIVNVSAASALYVNTFDSADDLEADWSYGHLGAQSANKVKDGKLFIGSDTGNWVSDLVDANYNVVYTDAVYEFDYSASKSDCYSGFGLRLPTDGKPDLFGGGRGGVAENDLGYGLSVDMFSKPNDGKIVIAFNNGHMQDSPYVALDIPAGFDVTQMNHVKVKDSGDTIEISLNGTLFATLKLGNPDGGYYGSVEVLKADGSSAASFDEVAVLEEGAIGFYQRNNNSYVDNLKISEISGGSSDPEPVVPDPEEPAPQPGTGDADVLYIVSSALLLGSALLIFKKKFA